MRLYIAGPMTGLPDLNYPAFLHAEEVLGIAGFETLNPVDIEKRNNTGKPQEWHWYMRHAIRMVLEADGVALLPGWRDSKGARLEATIAEALGLPLWGVAQWVNSARATA